MKPEYWDAIMLGLALGFSPLVVIAALIAIYGLGLVAWFYILAAFEWAQGKMKARA